MEKRWDSPRWDWDERWFRWLSHWWTNKTKQFMTSPTKHAKDRGFNHLTSFQWIDSRAKCIGNHVFPQTLKQLLTFSQQKKWSNINGTVSLSHEKMRWQSLKDCRAYNEHFRIQQNDGIWLMKHHQNRVLVSCCATFPDWWPPYSGGVSSVKSHHFVGS
jgi:hypothetical protein